MFNKTKKLEKKYKSKLKEAMQAQRNGDIQGFAKLTAEAEELKKKLDS